MASDARVCIFLGPTLPLDTARAELDAVYLPPVSQGDIYRIAQTDPWAIGIVDGYFDQVPAVWHKEILWAMSRGIHVYGSASMGALRAAELFPYGMEGVGVIYRHFRDGTLEDDDEVAIIHGPPEFGYTPLSDAMVNIRGTLAAATAAGVLSRSSERALVSVAKALHYPQRSFDDLVRAGSAHGLPPSELEAFERWLPAGRVDQKRADALEMLRAIRDHRARDRAPKRVTFTLEHSPYSVRAAHDAGEYQTTADGDQRAVPLTAILDHLGSEPGQLARVFDAALLRSLLLDEARRRALSPDESAVHAARQALCATHGLTTDEAVADWARAQGLSGPRFADLLREEALLSQMRRLLVREARGAVAAHLKSTGEFGASVARLIDNQDPR